MKDYVVTCTGQESLVFSGEILASVDNKDELLFSNLACWSEFAVFKTASGSYVGRQAHFSLNAINHYMGVECVDVEGLILFFQQGFLARKLYAALVNIGYSEFEYFAQLVV